ncbi:MAG: hypothetical protein AAB408_00875 [Patescibacteria group bacterium]
MLAESIAETFADFRARRADLLAHREKIQALLRIGQQKAATVAEKTMSDVRELVGVR